MSIALPSNRIVLLNDPIRTGLRRGLMGLWHLDEYSDGTGAITRADSSGRGHHLTDVNTVASAAGKSGNGALFVAADVTSLSVADHADLSFTGAFTLTAWVKLTTSIHQDLIQKWVGAGNNRSYTLYLIAGTGYRLSVTPDGATSTTLTASTFGNPPTGAWQLVLAWYDLANLNIQVNNGTVNQTAYTDVIKDSTADLALGLSGAAGTADTALDEVAMWNRALTGIERNWWWNGGNGRRL